MSQKAKWQHLGQRSWPEIRDAWLDSVPAFTSVGMKPDPGLDYLPTLVASPRPRPPQAISMLADVEGLRTNALAEAVFLFHKCSHAHLASQRLGQLGMRSWGLFNSYHAAYIAARGILTLLGAPLANLAGAQVVLDLFPAPARPKTRAIRLRTFAEFAMIPLAPVDQRQVWEALQRVLRVSDVPIFSMSVREEILDLPYDRIAPPRNHFLYKAGFWPMDDLVSDAGLDGVMHSFGEELDVADPGFLLRLSFCMYLLFEQLMRDLAAVSVAVDQQLAGSRCCVHRDSPELMNYRTFVSTVSAA